MNASAGLQNPSEHMRHIAHHLLIAEAEDAEVLSSQKFLTQKISLGNISCVMDAAINLDHQLLAGAEKIHDEVIDRGPAVELDALGTVLEDIPEELLCNRRRSSQLSRGLDHGSPCAHGITELIEYFSPFSPALRACAHRRPRLLLTPSQGKH